MSWFVLILSGMLEAVWATALSASDGFRKLWPTVLFFVTMTVSTVGLAWAMRELPTGTAYAVWVGIGATLTVLWAMVTKAERVSIARVALLVLLIGSVVGLKAVS
ncbi:multidrug efflux SMR transporter [Gulosibacter sp. 10]|uniref:DMT family transporter n=1 Tax=Gulosibacter sp. 10 TaxID=1255570 RepID=UPI00097EFA16|nr:multidrug efflux SMR transporter [Gulosibacter sp. 10]SJM51781.1 Quaternary ammonium compound-resistance protein SugE [Gulosibacter sp. 10]